MTLRASDPCRLLVLSRNAADDTEHAQLSCLTKGRSRRLGVQQRALPRHALGCLVSARDLHQGAGWESASERRAPGHSIFFHFLRCLFENTAAQFGRMLAATRDDALKTGHGGFKATRCCQNTPSVAQLTSLRATYKIKACQRQRCPSHVVVLSDGNQS